MIDITDKMLKEALPLISDSNIKKYLEPMQIYLAKFGILDNVYRLRAFLAQIGHESGQLKYPVELWGPTPAQVRYEGRKDLGNVVKGDGYKYRGRGHIQITGRDNYTRFDKWLHDNGILKDGESVVDNPDMVSERPELTVLCAVYFWDREKLNELADRER